MATTIYKIACIGAGYVGGYVQRIRSGACSGARGLCDPKTLTGMIPENDHRPAPPILAWYVTVPCALTPQAHHEHDRL